MSQASNALTTLSAKRCGGVGLCARACCTLPTSHTGPCHTKWRRWLLAIKRLRTSSVCVTCGDINWRRGINVGVWGKHRIDGNHRVETCVRCLGGHATLLCIAHEAVEARLKMAHVWVSLGAARDDRNAEHAKPRNGAKGLRMEFRFHRFFRSNVGAIIALRLHLTSLSVQARSG